MHKGLHVVILCACVSVTVLAAMYLISSVVLQGLIWHHKLTYCVDLAL